MFRWLRTFAGDLANAVTLWGLVGTVGVSGILGIVGPTILQPILGLPSGLRVALGVCVFLAALAVILASLKTLLERQSRGKGAQDPTPQSPEYSLWRELKRIETENQQLRDALQEGEQVNERLRNWIATITPFMHRMQLRWWLLTVWRMGNDLHEKQPPDVAAMEKWVSLTFAFIEKYLGEETANFFLVHDGDNSFAGRLRRLEEISDKPVEGGGPLQSEFDLAEVIELYPEEWLNRKGLATGRRRANS